MHSQTFLSKEFNDRLCGTFRFLRNIKRHSEVTIDLLTAVATLLGLKKSVVIVLMSFCLYVDRKTHSELVLSIRPSVHMSFPTSIQPF